MALPFDHVQYLALEPTANDIADKLAFLRSNGLGEYEKLALGLFGLRKWPALDRDRMVQQAVAASPGDLAKRVTRRNFYSANAMCFLETVRNLITPTVEARVRALNDPLAIENYFHLFQNLLFDSLHLLNGFQEMVKHATAIVPMWKRHRVMAIQMWHFARQSIYGQSTFHAFADKEPEMSAAVLRLAIEVKLREDTGVLGKHRRKAVAHWRPVHVPESEMAWSPILTADIARRVHTT